MSGQPSGGARLRWPPWAVGAAPMAVCLLVYHRALWCWFVQDDFAALRRQVRSWSELGRLFVVPKAQGTIRPFSEDLFFIVFRRLFDLNAAPYKLWVFFTQMLNLALLYAVAQRIVGRRPAAVLAPLVWGVNLALVAPLGWTSAYNQVLCAGVYLACFLLFLRHTETGQWKFYAAQCGTYLLGFGVLEAIVAYPAVVLAYCVIAARRHAWKALPLFAPAAAYSFLHLWRIPRAAGPYEIHFDSRLLSGLADYWLGALGPLRLGQVTSLGAGAGLALALALTAGLGAALWLADAAGRRAAFFGAAWFLITLGPMLPVPGHRVDYYLTAPAIGLGLMVAALAPHVPRAAAAAWLAIYLVSSSVFVQSALRRLETRSRLARQAVEGAQEMRRRHPGAAILLTGVDDTLFYAGLYDRAPLAAGIRDVFLAPSGNTAGDRPGYLPVDEYRLPASVALGALRKGEAVVYHVADGRFHNITNRYRYLEAAQLRLDAPRRVDVGLPYMAGQLGPGWLAIQQNHRWMGRRAEVRLAGPRAPGERLRVEVIYPDHMNLAPVELTVRVNGTSVGSAVVRDQRSARQEFALPPGVLGLGEITVTLEADHTFRPADDPRELGLAFGVIELTEVSGGRVLE